MKATLTSKGQITIPRGIRERLNLRPGDVLEFDEEATILLARRVIAPKDWKERVDAVCAAWRDPKVGSRRTAKDLLEESRGPVELPPETS